MRLQPECFPCFMNQVIVTGRQAGATSEALRRALVKTLKILQKHYKKPVPLVAGRVYRALYELTGVKDPYYRAKRDSNKLAFDLIDSMKRKIKDWNFEKAARIAMAGNLIDFGTGGEPRVEEIYKFLEMPLAINHITALEEDLKNCGHLLYAADNAGEIVFDRFFIEFMLSKYPHLKITVAVRGGPIINDALLEDAIEAGLTSVNGVRVVSNGTSLPGLFVEKCSRSFRKIWEEADLVISKGQGNLEGLSERRDKKIYFLLKAKCEPIARFLGVKKGSLVCKCNLL